ncbi:MAG: exodeoxyribonuclease V subunit gamma [Planctomycetes bacterium]|nr:exodeoxyribonuclease V subunit gamma [Planctomycetota bacterium]
MRFEVHQSHRLEDLLGLLAHRLRHEPLPPLEWETVLVPAQGLARWVQLRLAEHFGIVAGLRLPFPGAFLQDLCRHAEPGASDLFNRDVMLWRLWRVLGSAVHRDELGAAASYFADDPTGTKRLQLSRRLAGCFDDYQLYRDDVLLAFARGDSGKDHGPHGPWQANLWRALLADAGVLTANGDTKKRGRGKADKGTGPWLFPELAAGARPAPVATSAHRLERLRTLLADPARARAALPPRLSVFGAGTLPPAFVRLLQQIAAHVPVTLYVPQPTPHYFGDMRRANATSLLAALGDESREFAETLLDLEEGSPPLTRVEADQPDEPPPATLLACVQQDIVQLRDRGDGDRFPLRADDASLRVHDCHSPQRELEVVRDQILGAFADDPSLQPHEVLVLVPDVDRYAPYAHAVFGPVADHLPFHVADRSPARDLPLCKALLEVLDLATSRLVAFDVLHLLEEPSVRRRFGLFATDLPALRHLCRRSGIRWGQDGASREARHGVPAFEANSWRQGLDRLLLGAATGPGDDLFGDLLPSADTTEGRLPLLARFLHFADTLFDELASLREPRSLAGHAQRIDDLVATMFAPEGGDEELAVSQLHAATASLRATAAAAQHEEPVSLTVLRDWLLEALAQRTGARGFLAGAVTVAAMLPMRTVPARWLFVCGLDDASFPRRDVVVPFDLIAHSHRRGDRSRRLDDRQMFLDVLLAARDRLHLTFVGRSAKDDSPCAPSVVLAELLEHLGRTCMPPSSGTTVHDVVVVQHPLQPWGRGYRDDRDPRLVTFARATGAGNSPLAKEPAWHDGIPAPIAVDGIESIRLDDLLDFWRHPCRWYLHNVANLSLPRDDDRDDDSEPFSLHNLDLYHLQEAALRRACRGERPPADPFADARARGILPIGEHGRVAFANADEQTQRFLRAAMRHHATRRAAVTARGADFVIAGEVEGLGPEELVLMRAARMKAKDRLRAWILHVVLAVARHQGATDLPASTRVIARDLAALAGALEPDTAKEQLELLVHGFRVGRTAPLPLLEGGSFEYGKALHKGDDEAAAMRKARGKWREPDGSDRSFAYDENDVNVAQCMRGRDPFDDPEFRAWANAIWRPAVSYLHDIEVGE